MSQKKKMSKKTKIILWVLLGLVVVLLVAAGIGLKIGYGMLNAQAVVKDTVPSSTSSIVQANDKAHYIAHRGLCSVAPENTLPAITEAGKAGFYGTEFDIDRTKDGKWVLMHDGYIFRMLDENSTKKVSDYTYEELLEFSYDNGANIEQYPNLKITLLSDALDECKKYGMVPCVEFKSKTLDGVEEVVAMLRERGMEQNTTVLSFNLDHLKEVRKLSTDIKLWYLVKEISEESIADAKSLGGKCGLDFDGRKRDKNTPEMIQKIIDAGIEPAAWTIDKIEDHDYLYQNGVRYITTNVILPDGKVQA